MTEPLVETIKSRQFSPLVNKLLRFWQTSNLPLKYRLFEHLSNAHQGKIIEYTFGERRFVVPVDEWCFWSEKGPENYYLEEFNPFCEHINRLNQPFTFFDLGADIGTVSSLVVSKCPTIREVIAFEPNSRAYSLLAYNLAQIPLPCIAEEQAISNRKGQATINSNNTKTSDHEGSIIPDIAGQTPMTCLDIWINENNFTSQSTIVIKIDVEGQERAALEGAKALIQQAEHVIILIEFHPDVLAKTAETPELLMSTAEALRPFTWTVPALNNKHVDRNTPFYEQCPIKQYDVIGTSCDLSKGLHKQ